MGEESGLFNIYETRLYNEYAPKMSSAGNVDLEKYKKG